MLREFGADMFIFFMKYKETVKRTGIRVLRRMKF